MVVYFESKEAMRQLINVRHSFTDCVICCKIDGHSRSLLTTILAFRTQESIYYKDYRYRYGSGKFEGWLN